jgi:hypothetical protein
VALASFVLGLAVVNASGVYAQLVAAHVGQSGAARASIETQTANIDARIEVAAHAVADLDTRVSQIDSAVAAATRRGRTAGAMSIMEGQRRARAGLTIEREQAAGTLSGSPQGRTRLSGCQRATRWQGFPGARRRVVISRYRPDRTTRTLAFLRGIKPYKPDVLAVHVDRVAVQDINIVGSNRLGIQRCYGE